MSLRIEKLRAAGDVMQRQRGEHHRRRGAARNAERQQRRHRSGFRTGIAGFRGDHAFGIALAETFRMLVAAPRLRIGNEIADRRADSGQAADGRADNKSAQDHDGIAACAFSMPRAISAYTSTVRRSERCTR